MSSAFINYDIKYRMGDELNAGGVRYGEKGHF